MPVVSSGKILVTGANGYIAVWVCTKLLEQGYSVRGAVRSESKGVHLKNIFEKYGDKFEVVVVEDITKDSAFDDAVEGVDAIEHTASPFHLNAVDPAELIKPAVAGTIGVLRSALEKGTSVKRVVVTSSVAAVLEVHPNPPIFNEENWNKQAVAEIEANGAAASNAAKYRASKTLAEQAAWKFMETNPSCGFDLVVLNPPMVLGPLLHECDKPENLNTSMADFYKSVIKGDRTDQELITMSSSWVDVRDIAQAHVLALQKAEAAGHRIIVSFKAYVWQEWVNIAHKIDPSLPAGNKSADLSKVKYPFVYDTSKSRRLLGINYREWEETTRDILSQFKQKGWY